MTKFVWYKGKVWRKEGHEWLKDHRGRVLLKSLSDPSLGVSANEDEIREVDKKTEDGALWFLSKGGREQC